MLVLQKEEEVQGQITVELEMVEQLEIKNLHEEDERLGDVRKVT